MSRTAIVGGEVVDGTGRRRFPADVVVEGGRVVAVGPGAGAGADARVDGTGLVTCPGFVDAHSHDDLAVLEAPEHVHAVRQGVTSVVVGQDGLSYVPLDPARQQEYRSYLVGLYGPGDEVAWEFATVAEYLRSASGAGVNVAICAPHGAVRLEALGFDDRPLRGPDLERATAALAEAFADGAVALSTGLSYYPGSWSDTDELVALAGVAAAWGRPYVTHLRSVYREEPADRVAAGVAEALEVGRRSGAAVHFSHYRTWAHNLGETAAILAEIDEAKRAGQDVTLELYPYLTGSSLAVVHLPPWAQEGGVDAILARLADPALRPALRQGVVDTAVPHDGRVTFAWGAPGLEGRPLSAIAEERGTDLVDALLDLIAETRLGLGLTAVPPRDPEVWRRFHRDVLELLDRPDYMLGSDAIPTGGAPHPRVAGTFPKALRLARELGTISLERLVHRLTALPARRFGLHGRGLVAPGAAADLVVLDPAAVAERADEGHPLAPPVGIHTVLVNGEAVVAEGESTGARPGRGLAWGGGRP